MMSSKISVYQCKSVNFVSKSLSARDKVCIGRSVLTKDSNIITQLTGDITESELNLNH